METSIAEFLCEQTACELLLTLTPDIDSSYITGVWHIEIKTAALLSLPLHLCLAVSLSRCRLVSICFTADVCGFLVGQTVSVESTYTHCRERLLWSILVEGAIALPVTPCGGVLLAS